MFRKLCCFCRIKGKKSESNSQPYNSCFINNYVVSAVSKVRNLKAIHNSWQDRNMMKLVVSAVSKVRNLKAIHNYLPFPALFALLFLPYQR